MSSTATAAAVVGTTVGLLKESAIFQRVWMLISSICSLLFWVSPAYNGSPLAALKGSLQWAHLDAASSFTTGIAAWLHEPSHAGSLWWLSLLLVVGLIVGATFSPTNLAGFSVYPVMMIWAEVSDAHTTLWAATGALVVFLLALVLPKVGSRAVDHGVSDFDGHLAHLRLNKSIEAFIVCPFYVLVLPVILMVGL